MPAISTNRQFKIERSAMLKKATIKLRNPFVGQSAGMLLDEVDWLNFCQLQGQAPRVLAK